jgi:hypothetical protein
MRVGGGHVARKGKLRNACNILFGKRLLKEYVTSVGSIQLVEHMDHFQTLLNYVRISQINRVT